MLSYFEHFYSERTYKFVFFKETITSLSKGFKDKELTSEQSIAQFKSWVALYSVLKREENADSRKHIFYK